MQQQNRDGVPKELVKKKQLHKTDLFPHDSEAPITLTSHWWKRKMLQL